MEGQSDERLDTDTCESMVVCAYYISYRYIYIYVEVFRYLIGGPG